jgi:peptidoglycan/LPS O-acetylase OafA/YrhL
LFLIGLSFVGIVGIIFKGQQFFNFFVIPYLILNISLIFFTIIYTSSQNWTDNTFIHFLNNQSLGIYLYHPMFIFIAYEYLDDPKMNQTDNLTGFIIFGITVLLTSTLVWLLTQFEITNKYVLGNIKKENG